ncbi:MAG: alpha-amylase/4-alpha-glucanotransferase domain-containing protein [bacterium]
MHKINLAFGIHNHQPVGNFDFVFEDAYKKAYLPFLEHLEQHPKIRMALHYSGILFQWIKEHKPDFILGLKKLVHSGQIEIMTGGYYEPILSVIPYRDKIGQIKKLTNFIRQNTGYDPKGMWLAERIWEPHLPKPAYECGVKYVVLDDSHFKNAGLQDEELLGYYITEEEGATVYLFPISETLRYTIPFQPPEKTIAYLKSIATEQGETLVVFADDGEKFGIWPGTYEHCYTKGWLEQFFQALEENLDWINILHFSEALEKVKPLGRIYLPTASYREMMEWAMPTRAILDYEQFEEVLKQEDLHEKYKVFVRGGFWRNFMAKYPEANNMHKKMLHISRRLADLRKNHGVDECYEQAQNHLWAGQCNCPYWHGVFGGLYLNHLRYATYHSFIQAERILDKLERSTDEYENSWLDFQKFDYNGDGLNEVILTNKFMNLYFTPEKGGSLFEWDYKPKAINLLDTMTRREESYHKKLLEMDDAHQNTPQGDVLSIHDLVILKEEGLQNKLFYDWYQRTSLIDHFLKPGTTLEQFAQCKYSEAGDFVHTPFEFSAEKTDQNLRVKFWRNGRVWFEDASVPVILEKEISLFRLNTKLMVTLKINNIDTQTRGFWFGTELDFALLAGDSKDRYFHFPGVSLLDARLRSMGEIRDANEVQLIDEWLGLRLALKVEKSATIWRFPIETISQSEAGFEQVYQSSVVFPNWKFQLDANASWETQLLLTIEDLKR